MEAPGVPGPAVAPGADIRQPDLFRPPVVEPCKPALRDKLPVGPSWRYEVKHDGYRLQAHCIGGEVRLYTKRGLDWTDRMPGIRDAVAAIGRDVVLDGEAVVIGEDGIADFFALHGALARRSAPAARLLAFDVLWLDDDDVWPWSLTGRRELLAGLLPAAGDHLAIVESMKVDEPARLIAEACAMGLEGIVAKRIDKPYKSGEREDWIKVRCTSLDHVAVIGFEPAGRRGVSSLRIARLLDGALVPCGWAGSRIGETMSRGIRTALDSGRPVVVEVEHRGHSPAGELRHPVVKAWRSE